MSLGLGYRDTLRHELVSRCDANPRYSLRAFARDLGLDPARLSDILNEKKGLSREVAQSIAKTMGLNPAESELFCLSVESLHSRSSTAKQSAKTKLRNLTRGQIDGATLSLDAFKAISDWYHLAVLQLLKLPKSKDDPSWIARSLGLKSVQVEAALDRMQRLGMIKRLKGKLTPCSDWVFTPDGVPSDALKKFHEQILKKAMSAIYTQSVHERNNLTVTMPVASRDIESAKLKIRDFLESFSAELSSSPDCDTVYCFSTQYFNLTPLLTGAGKP
jgi:uncharacterized protein (TIGR02147 family)